MKQTVKKGKVLYLSFLLILFGSLIFFDGVLVALWADLHTGVILTLFLGAILVTVGVFCRKKPTAFSLIACLCYGLGFLLLAFLPLYGAKDTVTYDEDVVIVLGAGLRGEEPLPTLEKRLDRAYEYAVKNPAALIIVAGGQGAEPIAESTAMKRYLVEKGVASVRIFEENNSHSTKENLANTRVLLEEMGVTQEKIALVTSDYHVARALDVAEDAGFSAVTFASSETPFLYALPSWIREWVAILYYEIF